MPRSKRDKEVSLTKVKKKTRVTKESLVDEVRHSVDSYKNLFVFTIDNMRSKNFIAVRQHFKLNSRFFFGKNNVMAVALGRQATDEYSENLHKVSLQLKGQCGLMFTNASEEEVLKYFSSLKEADYARSGDIAPESISLPEGPLPQFAFSMEPQLRKLGMPSKLDRGAVALYQDFEVCKEGEPLTVEQAKILKLLDMKLSFFQLHLKSHWSKDAGFNEI